MKIAVAAEIAPAKAFVPLLPKINAEFLGLTHGAGAEELLKPYCTETYSIGEGRGAGAQKRSGAQIGYLVMKDILKAVGAMKGKQIDLLLSCGNAGDVRKAISAANLLRIPVLHIEQDIYNPIEMIAFADVITAPSENYKNYLETHYDLNNVHNIGGFPMATYVNQMVLMDEKEIKNNYGVDDFILLALGGDLKGEQIPHLIKIMEDLDERVLIAPFRFDPEYVRSCVNSSKVSVLDGFVDLPSLMKAAQTVIYGAGMGITIEAGVLQTPAIKIAGFHHQHSSVDLAHDIGIPVVGMGEIPSVISGLEPPRGAELLKDSQKSVNNVVNLVENFQDLRRSKGGISTLKKIWKARSQFR